MLAAGVILLLSMFLDQGLCLIKRIYGIPCPACGMTRATLALLRLDLQQAFHYHPLVWLPPLVLVGILFHKLSNRVCIVIAVLIVGVWIVRMITMFPSQISPMVFNETAIIPSVIRFLFFK